MEPYNIDGMLSELDLAGIFNQVSGVIFGSFEGCNSKKTNQSKGALEEVINDCSSRLKIPYIKNFSMDMGNKTAYYRLEVLSP